MRSRIVRNIAVGCMVATAAAAAPTFEASLENPEAKASKAEATVKIQVSGIQLVDPASVQEKPKAGQGHLHYRVDAENPVVGAPCGVMDQVAVVMGTPGRLLPILCRPASVRAEVALPDAIEVVGWPTGAEHDVSGVDDMPLPRDVTVFRAESAHSR